MLEFLYAEPLNVVVIGDVHVTPVMLEEAVRSAPLQVEKLTQLRWGPDNENDFSVPQQAIEKGGAEAVPCAAGLDEAIVDADVLVTHFSPVPRKVLEKAKRLKAVLTCRGGLEHIDVAAATELGIPVVNVIRNAIPVAEFALGLILSATRCIAVSNHQLMQGNWQRNYPNQPYVACLGNITVGLAGLGNVGIELATRLAALGVPLMAYEPCVDAERLARNGLDGLELVGSLEELFERADVISLHMRLTPETTGIVNAKLLEKMKPSAYLVNTARGRLVEQQDLIDALRGERIAGAALDVFETEPTPVPSGFAGLENVTLTPHIAGTTPDALPKSPLLLMAEVDKIIQKGFTERVVNYAAMAR